MFDIMLNVGSLKSDCTQHDAEEKLRIFWNTNSIYYVVRLKHLGYLVTHTGKENPNL